MSSKRAKIERTSKPVWVIHQQTLSISLWICLYCHYAKFWFAYSFKIIFWTYLLVQYLYLVRFSVDHVHALCLFKILKCFTWIGMLSCITYIMMDQCSDVLYSKCNNWFVCMCVHVPAHANGSEHNSLWKMWYTNKLITVSDHFQVFALCFAMLSTCLPTISLLCSAFLSWSVGFRAWFVISWMSQSFLKFSPVPREETCGKECGIFIDE